MMKIVAIAGLSLVVIFLGIQVVSFVRQTHQLTAAYANAKAALTKAQTDEANLKAEQQYLANPANLEKEIRARFNFVNPGEKMIIITPTATSSISATSAAVSD
jgi:cell division protein FtsL